MWTPACRRDHLAQIARRITSVAEGFRLHDKVAKGFEAWGKPEKAEEWRVKVDSADSGQAHND